MQAGCASVGWNGWGVNVEDERCGGLKEGDVGGRPVHKCVSGEGGEATREAESRVGGAQLWR